MIVFSRIIVLIALAVPWLFLALDPVCEEEPSLIFSFIAFPFGILTALSFVKPYMRDIEFYKRGPQYYPVDSGVEFFGDRTPDVDGYSRLLVFYPFVYLGSSAFVMLAFSQIVC